MSVTNLQDRIQRLADTFLSKDFADASIYYAEPLVAYIAGEPEVDLNRQATGRAIGNLRDIALMAGARLIRSTILDTQAQGDARFSALIRWEYLAPDEKVLDYSDFRFFCTPHPETGFQVKMLEVHRMAFANWPNRASPLRIH